MKKLFTLCVVFLVSVLPMLADNITAEEAQSLALSFLSQQQGQRKVSSATPSEPKLVLAGQLSDCYIFNRSASAGYVIVASDDLAAQPILAYADQGKLDADNLPCNLKWWLSQYAEELEWARKNPQAASQSASARKAPVVSKAAIAPLVQSHWNQSAPYNNLCPQLGSQTCVTGCVATATAQIMRYHKHPAQGKGSHSYTWNGQTLSRDFSQSTYDWDNMLLDYGSSYTSAQAEAVARLMVDVGYAVDMSYSLASYGGSGAVSANVASALPNYFGYSSSLKHVERNIYGLTDWINLLYNELVEERPVYFAGQSTDGGHAFVLDGYKQGYFHINWGWGGMSDGYFLISALDPDSQGIGGSSSGYNSSQEAIIGIEPGDGSGEVVTETKPVVVIDEFPSPGTVSRSGSFTYYYGTSGYIWNKGTETLDGRIGLKVVDEQGNVTYLSGSSIANLPAGYGYSSQYNFSVSLSNFPTDKSQTYKVYPAYVTAAGTWYNVTVTAAGDNYLVATTDGSNVYFSMPVSTVKLTATNIELPTKIFASKSFTVKANINAKGGEYNGNIYAYTSGSESSIGSASVNVDEQTSATVGISCTAPSAAGTYTMTLKDKDGNAISDAISYTVEEAPTGNFAINLESCTFINTAADDLHVKASFNCTSGSYSGTIIAFIFPEGGGSSLGYLKATLDTWNGDTPTLEFQGSFAGNEGTKYAMVFEYISNNSYVEINSYPNWQFFTLTAAGTKATTTSYENIGELIDDAYTQFKATSSVSSNSRPKLSNVQVNFDKEENPATVVAVLKYQDTNDGKASDVEAGYIFVVDQSERGLMLMPSSNKNQVVDLTSLKVGDVITGQLAGNYTEKSGIPAFEVRKTVSQGSGTTKVTYTSGIETDTSGEATETEEATYPVTQIPNVYYLAKTNEQDVDGNTNVGDVTKQAYGNYLNSIITVSGTIREKNGEYYLLQNEDDAVDDADLHRIYLTADELPEVNLADYVGCTGTIEGLLIKRNITEAKLSAQKINFFNINKLYISELDGETRISDLVSYGALTDVVDVYLHRTKLVAADQGYGTICLPFNLSAAEFKSVFGCEISLLAEATATVSNEGVQKFAAVESKNIVAGTPYLLKAAGTQTQGNGSSTTDSKGVTTYDDNYWTHIGQKTITVGTPAKVEAAYDDNIVNGQFFFCGSYGKKQYTTGTDGKPTETLISDSGSQKYQYISTNDGTLRYLPASSTLAFNGLRAYYYYPNWNAENNNALNPNTGSKSIMKIVVGDETVTSIDGIRLDSQTEAPIYNLQGQPMGTSRSRLPKGIYIQNGRKITIK